MPSYEKNKVHIYKWRITHQDHYRQKHNQYQLKYNEWKRIQKVFLNILII